MCVKAESLAWSNSQQLTDVLVKHERRILTIKFCYFHCLLL